MLGPLEGMKDGRAVDTDGVELGVTDGCEVEGPAEGITEGTTEGPAEGPVEGPEEGTAVEGIAEGTALGKRVGEYVDRLTGLELERDERDEGTILGSVD